MDYRSIRPTHEHFISNLIRQKLIVNIDALKITRKPNAKKFLLFTPENELHELALLFQHYMLKLRNHQVVYIGLSIPLHDIVAVFHHEQPDYLVSVLTTQPSKDTMPKYLNTLSENFNKTKIIVTGNQVKKYAHPLPKNMMSFHSLNEFISFVDAL